MKNKIQTILLMGLALTSMGSIAASDTKSQSIQSIAKIYQSIEKKKKYTLFVYRNFLKNLLIVKHLKMQLIHNPMEPVCFNC